MGTSGSRHGPIEPRSVIGPLFVLDHWALSRPLCCFMRFLRAGLVAIPLLVSSACAQSSGSAGVNSTRANIGIAGTTATNSTGSLPVSVTTSTAPTTSTTRVGGTSVVTKPDPTVVAAYQSALDAQFEAEKTSDQQLPALFAMHLDPLLTRLKDRLIGRRLEGQAARRPEPTKSRTTVLSTTVTGDTAEVIECTVDDGVVYVMATGAVVNDKVASMRRRATLSKDGDVWKVADRVTEQEWEGVAGCASS